MDPDLEKIRRRLAAQTDELLHSAQLDERLRSGNPEATPADKARKAVLDSLVVVVLALMITVVLGKIGLFGLSIAAQTYILAGSLGMLAGCGYLFTQIRWRAMRKHKAKKVLNRASTDMQLTMVSILALFTVVVMVIIEIGAFAVFLGLYELGNSAAAFAGNFVLLQAFVLLVYLLALVAREVHETAGQPSDRAKQVAMVMTPLALVIAAMGAFLATGLPQQWGLAGGIEVSQAVYIVTLGVVFEFIAMRIRLRLPSLSGQFKSAIDQSRRAPPEEKAAMKSRAMRAYIFGIVFVAGSMAFAGAVGTGAVGVNDAKTTMALVIFYVGTAIIMLGLIALRVLQSRNLKEYKVDSEDELERLVGQKRRSAQEVFRMSIYGVAGILGFIFFILTILTAAEKMPWEKKYMTDLFILTGLVSLGPWGFFYNRNLNRIEALDEKFPDLLRDIADSARAGMTLPRALVSASQGSYGALTDDVRKMAAQVEWGVEFGEALNRFADRAKTPLIARTVSLVREAQRAGGNVVDILTAASEDAREIKQIVGERNEQMKMYSVVIYIAYFVFIAVVLVLSAQFIPAFKDAVDAGAAGEDVGGLSFKEFDPEDFNTLFFHAALVQAIGGGLVGGVLTRGNAVAGFMSIAIMMVLSWLSFRVVMGLL